jgi:hypothetical protein
VLERVLEAGGVDGYVMSHPAPEPQAALVGAEGRDDAILRELPGLAVQRTFGKLAPSGIEGLFEGGTRPLGVAQLGNQGHRDGTVDGFDLVDHAHEVTMGERHEACRADGHSGAFLEPPEQLPLEHGPIEVQRALVAGEVLFHAELAVLDEEPDARAVRHAGDRLAGAREAVRVLGVADGPRLVEAGEQRRRAVGGSALLPGAANTDVPVREGEHRLELRIELARRPAQV